jgi:hypothetical protein
MTNSISTMSSFQILNILTSDRLGLSQCLGKVRFAVESAHGKVGEIRRPDMQKLVMARFAVPCTCTW